MRAMRFLMADESSLRLKQPTTDLSLQRSLTQASASHRRMSPRFTIRSTRPRVLGRAPASGSRCRMASSRNMQAASRLIARRVRAPLSASSYRPHASALAFRRWATSLSTDYTDYTDHRTWADLCNLWMDFVLCCEVATLTILVMRPERRNSRKGSVLVVDD